MKARLLVAAIAAAWVLSMPGAVLAKGSGGGHGSGGHGGGHASGGHGGGRAAGSHGGGHTGGGQRASGGNRGGQSTTGTAQPRGSSSGSSTTAGQHSRGTRPAIGTAVPRTPSSVVTPQFFLPSRTTLPFAFGYYRSRTGFYDPFWPAFGYYTNPYGYAGYPPDLFATEGPTGAIRLKVTPRDAAVYVDGYYAGIVDDFDGHFQHLKLTSGPHHIEINAAGYEALAFDVDIQAHHTIDYRGALQRVVQ